MEYYIIFQYSWIIQKMVEKRGKEQQKNGINRSVYIMVYLNPSTLVFMFNVNWISLQLKGKYQNASRTRSNDMLFII